MITRTLYQQKMKQYLNTPVVKVITGMRRTGKSTILKQSSELCMHEGAGEKDILIINMESLENAAITDSITFHDYVKKYFGSRKGKRYLFVDEIQEIAGWEKTIASLLAEKKTDIIITGSNAHLLSSELATLLTGRYVTMPVYPLTFTEYLTFRGKKFTGKRRDYEEEFLRYMRYGGLPGIHHFPDSSEIIEEYLSSVMNSILLRDVVMRNAVRDPALLEKICRFVFDNCGNITTSKGIAEYAKSQRLKITVDTVISYISYLESAYLVTKVPRYDIKGKKHLEIYDKYYMGDMGLRHGFIGYRDRDISALLENIVYNELRVRGYTVSVGRIGEYEIDFIAQRQEEKIYIQVAYLLSSTETIEREYRSLESVQDSFPKYILSMDPVQQGTRNGIIHKHIIDYLLEKPF